MEKRYRRGIAAGTILISLLVLAGGLALVAEYRLLQLGNANPRAEFNRFDTCSGIFDAFNESRSSGWGYRTLEDSLLSPTASIQKSDASGGSESANDFSGTNIQVEGVDEADIVKTDGEYIYAISGNTLVIIRAYPEEDADVVSETDLGEFSPSQMFVHGDNLMLFGYTSYVTEYPEKRTGTATETAYAYPYYMSLTTVQLWDISERDDPEKAREVDFEGNYLTARKIGDYVYFVVNSYPTFYDLPENPIEILPVYRDSTEGDDFVPSCGCSEVGRLVPSEAQSFITLVSMSMTDHDADIEKEVIVGSGQNVYASQDKLYIAESIYRGGWLIRDMVDAAPGEISAPQEVTAVHKFSLDSGKIEYVANAEVPGRVLNQFSMDEYDGYFRIAMTEGRLSRTGSTTTNNIYVYDDDMELTGSLEDLAPGESIYSARFMGDRGYLVTFKKIDPLFVIDLSDPEDPEVLGKLKIPGYSDYLHPYDEDHIIGIGKETVPGDEDRGDFSWHQGVKIALFDVSDVENPEELHKVVIGDRGTDSEILNDHKAFLFDRERELLVIPILLAEIDEDVKDLPDWAYGDYVYQGAYVYDLNLEDGFDLRGRITHYDDDDAFEKSGYYFRGGYSIRRSLYIDDVLYTLSNNRLKLNYIPDLEEIAVLDFGTPMERDEYWY